MSTNEMPEIDLDTVDSTYSPQQTENSTLLQIDAPHTPVNSISSSTTQLNLPSHDSNTQLDLHPYGFILVGIISTKTFDLVIKGKINKQNHCTIFMRMLQ